MNSESKVARLIGGHDIHSTLATTERPNTALSPRSVTTKGSREGRRAVRGEGKREDCIGRPLVDDTAVDFRPLFPR